MTALLVALAAPTVLAACGKDRGQSAGTTAAPPGNSQAAGGHIHGLGVNPRDGSLLIATHFGLFRSAKGSTQAPRLGDSRQDVMGFSVLGLDRFLGSGHPAPGEDAPPLLGLIESRDAGRTWKPISLAGEADFHVLRSAGSRVYGFDSSNGRLLVSDDAGRSWSRRSPPGPLLDLAIDPKDNRRAVASTQDAIAVTADAGKRWRSLQPPMAGLLAWPAADRLYLIDGTGAVSLSADAGKTWRQAASVGGPPAALAAHARDLFAALQDGTVKQSVDGGKTWTVRATLSSAPAQ